MVASIPRFDCSFSQLNLGLRILPLLLRVEPVLAAQSLSPALVTSGKTHTRQPKPAHLQLRGKDFVNDARGALHDGRCMSSSGIYGSTGF